MNENIKKDNKISLIRCISTFMIVSCHFLQYYQNFLAWWLNTGVQIFLVMSGYLYGQKVINNSLEFIINNVKKVIFDYYLYLIIVLPIYFIMAKELITIEKVIELFACFSTLSGLNHFWFIIYIILCYILTPFFNSYFKRYCKNKCSTLKYTLLLLIAIQIIGYYYFRYFTIEWINCYFIGYLIGKYTIMFKDVHLEKYIFGILLLTAVVIIIQVVIQQKIDFNNYLGGGYRIFIHVQNCGHMLLGVSIFLLLLTLFQYVPVRKRNILDISDRYSYDIYIVHHIYILGPFSLMEITQYKIINIITILILIILSSIFLEHIRIVILNYIYNRKIN